MKRLVIGIELYKEGSIFEMIVELFALGMAKSLNLSVDFAINEDLNGFFKTDGKEERPIFWDLN